MQLYAAGGVGPHRYCLSLTALDLSLFNYMGVSKATRSQDTRDSLWCRFAQRERIICVQPRWVDDCLARGCCLDEAQFLVVDREDQTGQSRCGLVSVAWFGILCEVLNRAG